MSRRRTGFCFTLGIVAALGLSAARADTNSAALYLASLVDFERYAETIWHTAAYSNAPADAGYWGDGGSSGNGGIRGNCGVAVAYAVLVKALPNDPKLATRLGRIRQALNYAAGAHVSGTNLCVNGKQWGWSSSSSTDWQTPLWSGSLGLACILVQSQLPAQTVQACQRVVASEATHRAGIAPPSGYVGDTKAEENAWDSNILALGAAWMNTHSNAATWLAAAKSYLVNSYTVANTNGDPLAAWISTVTLYPSFALENHGFYHPTYEMVAGMSLGDSLLMAQLANPAVAAQLQPSAEHNVMAVWTNNLSAMVMDSGDFAYPAGIDWELHDYEQNSYVAWLAAHFNDPLARWADGQLAQLVRYRQFINGDGTFVGPSGGGFYREAVEARRTAIAWLHWANASYLTGPVAAPAPVLVHFPDVKVLVQRGPAGNVSLSYGSRIMGMIDAPAASVPTNPYVASPLLPGVIGLGALGNPTAAQLVSLTTSASGFDAELTLQHGANGTTEVYFKSTGATVGIVEVPWPASGIVGSAASSFDVGIENDPLTGGTRLLEWTGGSATITNRSGFSRNVTNQWVCVAGRYGLAAGPTGYFNYQAASGYNRLGAAQDTLQFMPADSLAPRYAVFFPGQGAALTAVDSASIAWSVSGTNGRLTFPGPGGVPQQIAVLLPPAPPLPPPYPPYALPVAAVEASSAQTGYPAGNTTNGVLTDFWVSTYGPTNHAEWLKFTFARPVALSGFRVYPRTDNGGYGPKDIQLVVNVADALPASGLPASGTNVFSGTMQPASPLDTSLAAITNATNAVLVIISAYDRGISTAPRNVQVDEVMFFERALPGTFADWSLRQFTDAQLADPTVSGATADPDHDGAPNLLEFAMGGQPFVPDGTNFVLAAWAVTPTQIAVRFRERKDLGGVQGKFQSSADLRVWTDTTPLQIQNVADLGSVWLREAGFAVTGQSRFIRLVYTGP